jgi:hypothetical protein
VFQLEGNEDNSEFSVNLDKIYDYDVKFQSNPGLQRQNTVQGRSMIGSKFQRNYKDISIGFNKSTNQLKKARQFAEGKMNHEAYKILLDIYKDLKSKLK